MSTRNFKPVTPGRRGMSVIRYRGVLTTGRPHKSLVKGGKQHAGRNSFVRITTRHQGGGHKKRFRAVDFLFDKKNIPAKVEHIEYDPHRSGFIARVVYKDGERRYILAPQSLRPGDSILVSETTPKWLRMTADTHS